MGKQLVSFFFIFHFYIFTIYYESSFFYIFIRLFFPFNRIVRKKVQFIFIFRVYFAFSLHYIYERSFKNLYFQQENLDP